MRPLFLIAAASAVSAQHYDNLDAVLWAQTSVEFQASVRQVYVAARASLDRALATPYWTAVSELPGVNLDRPPAIILDVDETVVDNSSYRARLLKSGGKPFALDSWNAWVKESKAPLLPGAREFLDYAKMRGVRIFFVTNRDCKAEMSDPTFRNLQELGLGGELKCRESTSDKGPRRAAIAADYRVLLLIGDDINDFFTPPATLEGRQQMLDRYAQFFGDRWFLVPNPMYGSWERPFGDNLQKKLGALRP